MAKADLTGHFLKGLDGENHSYYELFILSVTLMWSTKDEACEFAAEALHRVYENVTGEQALIYLSHKNSLGYHDHVRTAGYDKVAAVILKRLERISKRIRPQKAEMRRNQERYDDTVKSELGRGADPDRLRDIGYHNFPD